MSDETVAKTWGLRCPMCKQDDRLRIACTVWLDVDPSGTWQDANCDHEWDGDSVVTCGCGWGGMVRDATISIYEETGGAR